jgi:hypothetical protein
VASKYTRYTIALMPNASNLIHRERILLKHGTYVKVTHLVELYFDHDGYQ